jgi:hypothetical protein
MRNNRHMKLFLQSLLPPHNCNYVLVFRQYAFYQLLFICLDILLKLELLPINYLVLKCFLANLFRLACQYQSVLVFHLDDRRFIKFVEGQKDMRMRSHLLWLGGNVFGLKFLSAVFYNEWLAR